MDLGWGGSRVGRIKGGVDLGWGGSGVGQGGSRVGHGGSRAGQIQRRVDLGQGRADLGWDRAGRDIHHWVGGRRVNAEQTTAGADPGASGALIQVSREARTLQPDMEAGADPAGSDPQVMRYPAQSSQEWIFLAKRVFVFLLSHNRKDCLASFSHWQHESQQAPFM